MWQIAKCAASVEIQPLAKNQKIAKNQLFSIFVYFPKFCSRSV